LRRVAATQLLRVVLELQPERDPASGCLVDEQGRRHAFTGWLAFFALLEELDQRTDEGREQ